MSKLVFSSTNSSIYIYFLIIYNNELALQRVRGIIHHLHLHHKQENRYHRHPQQQYNSLKSDKKELAFNDIKVDLSECEKYLKLMETDIAPMPAQLKFDYLRKVSAHSFRSDNTSVTSTTAARTSTKVSKTTPSKRTNRC